MGFVLEWRYHRSPNYGSEYSIFGCLDKRRPFWETVIQANYQTPIQPAMMDTSISCVYGHWPLQRMGFAKLGGLTEASYTWYITLNYPNYIGPA